MTIAPLRRLSKFAKTVAVSAVCCSLVSACDVTANHDPSIAVAGPGSSLLIADIGEFDALPRNIGPFEREHTTIYKPGERDISVTYSIRSPALQAASTVYFYDRAIFPRGPLWSLAGQFADTRGSLEYIHPTGELIAQSPISIEQGGTVIGGLHALYRYDEPFEGARRLLASELSVFLVGDHFVKFRVTYPWEDQAERGPQIAELMQRIDWSDPAVITDYLLRY